MFFSKEKETNPQVLEVSEITGWKTSKARAEMDKAKELGISYKRYIKLKCWQMNEQEIHDTGISETRRKEQIEKDIAAVQENTGWTREQAMEKMKPAREKGVSFFQYARRRGWELSDDEIEVLAAELPKAKEARAARKNYYIDSVAKKAGWTREKSIEEMEKAKKMGISYRQYLQKACWELEEDMLEPMAKSVIDYKENVINANKAKYIKSIMQTTGWSQGKTELEILKAKNLTGCSYEDYLAFRFYDLTPQEQQNYVTLDLFSKMRVKYNEHFTASKYFDDKAMFNKTFNDFINRRWFVNENLSYDEYKAKTEDLSEMLVKPLASTQGIGIKKILCNVNEEADRQSYDELMASGLSIAEQYIVQHSEMMEFCPQSVNTLRITTLNHNGECHFLYSVFRMGRGAVVDNFHAGGIAAAVDVTTGKVITDATDLEGNTFEYHPVSNKRIRDFQIPNWEKILDVCRHTYNMVENVNLIGWDFAITPDGVDLIEGNPGASYVVAQLPFVAEKKGIKDIMCDPYL